MDFAETVDVEHRAGIEAALIASGILTATVDGTGQLAAGTDDLLVTPRDRTVPTSLTTVLTVDPACPLPTDTVETILNRIGFGATDATTWISADGGWSNGAAPVH